MKSIDADYLIFDLGGDTTYNILDFYLAADQGLVLTTCEPAAYLYTYGFIKTALHRELSRLFRDESNYREFRDFEVERLIKGFIFNYKISSAKRQGLGSQCGHRTRWYLCQRAAANRIEDGNGLNRRHPCIGPFF